MATEQLAWTAAAGVKGLSEDGANVPTIFVMPLHSRVKEEELCFLEGIPLIDFSHLNVNIVQEVADAAQSWGFFQIENHGVPLELMDSMLNVTHEFFNMPPEDKMLYFSDDVNALVGYGTSYEPAKEDHHDWHDHLNHTFPSLEQEHPWPEKPASYRQTSQNYLQEVTELAKRIAAVLSQGLGLDPEYLYKAMKGPQVLMRLNYYPPCSKSELVLGQTAHCDYGTFTVLMQDNVEGLQVLHDGKWCSIKPMHGTFIVNVGDQLELWSNQKLKSAKHRVAVSPRETRISVATFYLPDDNVFVSPIPEMIDELHPQVYEGCLLKDYFKKTSGYVSSDLRALDSLRKI